MARLTRAQWRVLGTMPRSLFGIDGNIMRTVDALERRGLVLCVASHCGVYVGSYVDITDLGKHALRTRSLEYDG